MYTRNGFCDSFIRFRRVCWFYQIVVISFSMLNTLNFSTLFVSSLQRSSWSKLIIAMYKYTKSHHQKIVFKSEIEGKKYDWKTFELKNLQIYHFSSKFRETEYKILKIRQKTDWFTWERKMFTHPHIRLVHLMVE